MLGKPAFDARTRHLRDINSMLWKCLHCVPDVVLYILVHVFNGVFSSLLTHSNAVWHTRKAIILLAAGCPKSGEIPSFASRGSRSSQEIALYIYRYRDVGVFLGALTIRARTQVKVVRTNCCDVLPGHCYLYIYSPYFTSSVRWCVAFFYRTRGTSAACWCFAVSFHNHLRRGGDDACWFVCASCINATRVILYIFRRQSRRGKQYTPCGFGVAASLLSETH